MATIHPLSPADYYYPVGVCIEAIFFGFYTLLFITALWIWRTLRLSRGAKFSGLLYLIVIVLMWIVAALHLGICIWRLLRVFILELKVDGPSTHVRLLDATRWDTVVHMALTSCMIWLGDILVIYRTYIVWDRNFWVIIAPIFLHVAYLVVNSLATFWLSHPKLISPIVAYTVYRPVFPLVFAQNLLTTALLSYKILAQHRISTANGVHASGTRSLATVARTIVETAMIYTLELLVIIVLGSIKHPATGMVVICLVPTAGIVFVLMYVRVHFSAVSKAQITRHSAMATFPDWIRYTTADDGIELSRPASVAAAAARVSVTLKTNRDAKFDPGRSSDCEHDQDDLESHLKTDKSDAI